VGPTTSLDTLRAEKIFVKPRFNCLTHNPVFIPLLFHPKQREFNPLTYAQILGLAVSIGMELRDHPSQISDLRSAFIFQSRVVGMRQTKDTHIYAATPYHVLADNMVSNTVMVD
jgi:hypothetical protein